MAKETGTTNVAIPNEIHSSLKLAALALPGMDLQKIVTEACDDWRKKHATKIARRAQELSGIKH